MQDVLRAESVARGHCRAIVRVPWDDHLSSVPAPPRPAAADQAGLHRAGRRAVAGLSAAPASPVPGRNPGEHSD